ncbi:MAG: peptidylprolyl isomerase [Parcubacteria group bacterium]
MKNKLIIAGLVALVATASTLIFFAAKTESSKKTAEPEEIVISETVPSEGITNEETNTNQSTNKVENFKHIVTLETSLGTIKIETYDADAPKTVENFLKLASDGFYNGVMFHRVIDGFMIQGGDPTGTGFGGPGYTFADELNPKTESYKNDYKKGVVAMANSGPNTNGSQFFIVVADYPLPHNYTIFGRVIEGQDVADKIAKVKRDSADKPLEDVVIRKATVTEK